MMAAASLCIAAPALAQLILTESGQVDTGPCPGIAIHLTSPNDLTNAAWTKGNVTAANVVADPLGGTNASSYTSTITTCCATASQGNLSAATTYSLTGYFKSLVAPAWMVLQLQDNTSAAGYYINLGNATVGNTNNSGNGNVTCIRVLGWSNGYVFVSMSASVSAINGTLKAFLYAAGGNGNANPTNTESIAAYQVSP